MNCIKKIILASTYLFVSAHACQNLDESSNSKLNVTVELGKNRYKEPYCIISLKNNAGDWRGSLIFTYSDNHAQITSLGVDSDFQGKGYGTTLWNQMVHELKKLNVEKASFSVVPSGIDSMSPEFPKKLNQLVKWYEKRGAKIIEVKGNTPFMQFNIQKNKIN